MNELTTRFHTIASRIIHQGRYLTIREDILDLGDGKTVRRDVVDHPGAVVIVPLDAQGQVVMVRQYRHAAGKTLLELPAGTLERDEDPLACARRELREETGYAAARWEPLPGFFSAPGFTNEFMHLFLARDLSHDPLEGDEDEEIIVEPVSLADGIAMIDGGEIQDAKSIAGLLLTQRRLANQA